MYLVLKNVIYPDNITDAPFAFTALLFSSFLYITQMVNSV